MHRTFQTLVLLLSLAMVIRKGVLNNNFLIDRAPLFPFYSSPVCVLLSTLAPPHFAVRKKRLVLEDVWVKRGRGTVNILA